MRHSLGGFGSVDEVRVWRIEAADAERAQRCAAAALFAAGATAGDRVLVSVRPSPGVVALALGALRSGIVPVVVDPSLTEAERGPIVDDADAQIVVDSERALDELLSGDDERELAPVPLSRPMHYTSGTSGTPKGVWTGVLPDADATAMHDDEGETWSFSGDDVLLLASPLHHSAPLRFASGVLLRGGSVVLVERFDAATVAAAIARYEPTVAFLVPSHLRRLFALPSMPSLSSFRLVAHAGEACEPALKQRAIDAFPAGSVWEFYGSTEGQFTVCSPDEWLARPGTVGRARRHRVMKADDDGQLWCTAPPWARFEYWRDPAKTAAAWGGDAFTVGDLGRVDGEGYVFLDGRRDDLIISGGVNVYPAEVEGVLASVDGVRMVGVFGVDDERWGQRVCAAYVGANATEDDLRAAAVARLAPHKRPKQYLRVDDLPRTSTGKLRRAALPSLLQ